MRGEVLAPAIQMVTLLVAWLSLQAGVSRKTANFTLKALHHILITVLQIFHTGLSTAGNHLPPLGNLRIPLDICTVYSHHKIDPELIRVPCCPTCFLQYPVEHGPLPNRCTWKRSPRSKQCDTKLYTLVYMTLTRGHELSLG